MIVDRLAGSLGRKVGIAIALRKLRAAAEGRLGPTWKARYWWLVGKKTWMALALSIAAGVAVWLGYSEVGIGIGTAAGLLGQAGLLDKAWRGQLPTTLAESVAYRYLAQHSADLATLSGVVTAHFATCGQACDTYALAWAGVTAVLAELALLDPAARAKPPSRPPSLDRAA